LDKTPSRHILIFEPRTEGHHLSWLRYVTEDLLSAGFRVTVAVDWRAESKELIQNNLSALIARISIISIFNNVGNLKGGNRLKTLAKCFKESGAQEVFINNLDDIASHCLRSASVGSYPPKTLQGLLSGVYFRPRFLANPIWPPGNIIKTFGFRKLCKNHWFKNIFLMDEYLFADAKKKYADATFHFLPDPWDGNFSHSQKDARETLGIPPDQLVLLNYGIGDRRKGLHLTVRAMLESSPDSRLFLLCAGRISKDRELLKKLSQLEIRGRAKVLDRYVSDSEESLCFCASDVVLLPYIQHFGSSGVLSLSAAAGKMVIASDEGLVGRRVREHNLGWLFTSRDIEGLKRCMNKAALLSESDMEQFQQAALLYAKACSREAFRNALLASFEHF
jgi:glycosyltransferase involved in cell wall biosynthesis